MALMRLPRAWHTACEFAGVEPRAAAAAATAFLGVIPWARLYLSSAEGSLGHDRAALSGVALTAVLLGLGWLALHPKAVLRLRVAMAALTVALTMHGFFFAVGLRSDPYSPDGAWAIPGALAMLAMLPGLFCVVLPPGEFWRSRETKGFDRDLASAALASAGIACVGGFVYSAIRPNSVMNTVEHVPILAVSQLGPAAAWLFAAMPDSTRRKPAVTACAAALAVVCTRYWFSADAMLDHFFSFWPGMALWSVAFFGTISVFTKDLDYWAPEVPAHRPLPKFEFHAEGPQRPSKAASLPDAGPSAAPMEGEEFVSAGGFRLDRAQALEKLREHQFQRPEDFAVAWLRAAVASRASRLDIVVSAGFFRMSFDGEAFAHADLTDPFHALLDGGEARARELGFGLLGALRFEPDDVVLASGRDAGRSRLSVTLSRAQPEAGDASDDTVFEARWRRGAGPSVKDVAARLRSDFGLADLKVTLNGEVLPPVPPPGPAGWMEAGGADCRIWIAPRLEKKSLVHLYVFGALAGSVEPAFAPRQVEALVRDDRLSLDASRAKVVQDAELERVNAAVAGAVPELVTHLISLHATEVPRLLEAFRRAEESMFSRLLGRPRFLRAREADALKWWEAIHPWLARIGPPPNG